MAFFNVYEILPQGYPFSCEGPLRVLPVEDLPLCFARGSLLTDGHHWPPPLSDGLGVSFLLFFLLCAGGPPRDAGDPPFTIRRKCLFLAAPWGFGFLFPSTVDLPQKLLLKVSDFSNRFAGVFYLLLLSRTLFLPSPCGTTSFKTDSLPSR